MCPKGGGTAPGAVANMLQDPLASEYRNCVSNDAVIKIGGEASEANQDGVEFRASISVLAVVGALSAAGVIREESGQIQWEAGAVRDRNKRGCCDETNARKSS